MPEMTSDSSRMLNEKRSMAWRSGASSITISRKSPPIGAGPTTRITSLSLDNSVSKASKMARYHDTLRMSMSWWIFGGMSETASSRRCVPIFIATARAPTLPRICRARLSGTMPLGAASSTSAAVWAAASRSFSQLSRKFAIDGT